MQKYTFLNGMLLYTVLRVRFKGFALEKNRHLILVPGFAEQPCKKSQSCPHPWLGVTRNSDFYSYI